MNLTVNSQILAQELKLACAAINAKAALPVLQNALLVANANTQTLQINTTDLDIGVSTSCAARVSAGGSATAPAKRLLDFVNEFPDADVTLSFDAKGLRIHSGKFQSRMQTLPAADFPDVPAPQPDADSYPLPLDTLQALIERTRFATSDKNLRFFMSGAQLALTDKLVAMVATDGPRLALATLPRSGAAAPTQIVSNKALDFFKSAEGRGDCFLSVDERHLFLTSGDRVFHSRLVDGAFPDYQRVIPRDNNVIATLNRADFTAAMRRVVLAADLNKSVGFSFTAGALHLSAVSVEVGEAAEVVAAQFDSTDLKLVLNGQHVLDFLSVARNPSVELRMKDPLTAVLLQDGSEYINLVMPSRG